MREVRLPDSNSYWPIAAILLLADQLTKYLVSGLNQPLEAGPFRLARVDNRAGVFGWNVANEILIAAAAAVCLGLVYLLTQKIERPLIRLGLWLILGGAASNVVDRLAEGGVVDIITIEGLFSFNLADVMIVLGALAMLRGVWQR